MAGPPVVAGLLTVHTDAAAMGLLGAAGTACAVLLGVLLLSAGYEPEPALNASLVASRP